MPANGDRAELRADTIARQRYAVTVSECLPAADSEMHHLRRLRSKRIDSLRVSFCSRSLASFHCAAKRTDRTTHTMIDILAPLRTLWSPAIDWVRRFGLKVWKDFRCERSRLLGPLIFSLCHH